MKYMGSKNRLANDILPIILKDRKEDQWYIEPFVGGFNLIDKVTGPRLGNDINYYLIELFKAVQQGWDPPTHIDKELYLSIKDNKENYPAYLVGFVGFGCSFGGKWFGGYATSNDSKGNPRNHCLESRNNILNQYPGLQGLIITNQDYTTLDIPDNSIIYCDPPYKGTTQYKDKFNYEIFWNWVRIMSRIGHTVFVSEYNAPSDFECVFEKSINTTLSKDSNNQKSVEKLFKRYEIS